MSRKVLLRLFPGRTFNEGGKIGLIYSSSLHRVFKCTVMIDDMKEWPLINEVYVTYFKKDRLPARSAIGADGLALGAKVEIECMATVD